MTENKTDLLDLIWSEDFGAEDEAEVAQDIEIVDNKKIITHIESSINYVCGINGNRKKSGVNWVVVTMGNTTDNVTVPAKWTKKKVLDHFESKGYRAELVK